MHFTLTNFLLEMVAENSIKPLGLLCNEILFFLDSLMLPYRSTCTFTLSGASFILVRRKAQGPCQLGGSEKVTKKFCELHS